MPRPIRVAGRRLLGWAPRKPARILRLRLPVPPPTASTPRTERAVPRILAIPTRPPTYVTQVLEDSGLGAYEPDTLACFLAAIETQGASCVYDIGANIGVFSWLAAAFARVDTVAFEPAPNLAERIREICVENDLPIVVEELALGSTSGNATLYLSQVSDSSNSLSKGYRPSVLSVEVAVDTIDRYAARTQRFPEVLKIDTESTEPDVLRGAAGLLSERRPWIICEVLPGPVGEELASILDPLGYRYFRIDQESELRRCDTIGWDGRPEYLNWLFTPSEPDRDFWLAVAAWRDSLAALRATKR
jgi:FkbM family methyltransferase